MSNYKKKSDHVYDVVIVGAGLTGLAMGAAFKKAGLDFVILEATEQAGGHSRKIQTPFGDLDNGLKFFPKLESSQAAIEFINDLGIPMSSTEEENLPMAYEAGGFKDFLGFGDHPPEFHQHISYYLSGERLQLSTPIYQIAANLMAELEGDILTRNIVTKFFVEDGLVKEVLVNGVKTIKGKTFIFTGNLKHLDGLLPDSALGVRAKQKMLKSQFWTQVCLDLVFKSETAESLRLNLLDGTTQDEFGPCVGQFMAVPSDDSGLQLSRWVGFLSEENSEDAEQIGAALKKIKRQIKRAYPALGDQYAYERILVVKDAVGSIDLKLNSDQSLPTAENLILASNMLAPVGNIVGSLLQAKTLSESVISGLQNHQITQGVDILEATP